MVISTGVDFIVGKKIYAAKTDQEKKRWRNLSIVTNLSILGFFKYFNFFIEELSAFITLLGLSGINWHLSIILPVGISFYTFQTMSYSWDIYQNKIKPVESIWDFALFVSFFPQLVAGPIERAKHLLPQILKKREFCWDRFYEGGYLILWGLFKKIYIADVLAVSVNQVFSRPLAELVWVDVLIGSMLFAFQIYGDFSGYTDIARGTAKMLGFDIMLNFNFPYFSKSPSEFWRRWHISLSSWLKDYLYIPLGGNRGGTWLTYKNLMLTMVLGGLWHGANMTFVVWGVYQGTLLCLHKLWSGYISINNGVYRVAAGFVTFLLTCYGWLIFRSESLTQLTEMTRVLLQGAGEVGTELVYPSTLLNVIWPLLVVETLCWFKGQDQLVILKSRFWILRGLFYIALLYFISEGLTYEKQSFIYFQF